MLKHRDNDYEAEQGAGRAMDRATILKYLNQQPEHKLRAVIVADDKGNIEVAVSQQTGDQPPVVQRLSEENI